MGLLKSPFKKPRDLFHVGPQFQPLIRAIGLDARGVFSDPRVSVWRKLGDRENATLDARLPDGEPVRIHVKRYAPANAPTPGEAEYRGFLSLEYEKIPTATLVGWGKLTDGRSFTLWLDLAGYTPGDKLVEAGTAFDQLLEPTADLAAKLHDANLHHRDLYLCHFMAKFDDTGHALVRLIDTARVARLSSALTRRRWVVKDLAQFWYSTTKLDVTDDQRVRWLARYAERRRLKRVGSLRKSIERKVKWIANHDVRLKQKQPTRNVSIPAR